MESDAIVAFLDSLVVGTQEIHARYQWTKGMVALWDNRICVSRCKNAIYGVWN